MCDGAQLTPRRQKQVKNTCELSQRRRRSAGGRNHAHSRAGLTLKRKHVLLSSRPFRRLASRSRVWTERQRRAVGPGDRASRGRTREGSRDALLELDDWCRFVRGVDDARTNLWGSERPWVRTAAGGYRSSLEVAIGETETERQRQREVGEKIPWKGDGMPGGSSTDGSPPARQWTWSALYMRRCSRAKARRYHSVRCQRPAGWECYRRSSTGATGPPSHDPLGPI